MKKEREEKKGKMLVGGVRDERGENGGNIETVSGVGCQIGWFSSSSAIFKRALHGYVGPAECPWA